LAAFFAGAAAFFAGAFLAAFLVAIVVVLPFRFDIETATEKLQLTKGIEIGKKSVKKKINYCA
jgi:hypothetical protein